MNSSQIGDKTILWLSYFYKKSYPDSNIHIMTDYLYSQNYFIFTKLTETFEQLLGTGYRSYLQKRNSPQTNAFIQLSDIY